MPTEIQSTPVTEPLRPGLGRFLIVLAMAQGGQEPITAAELNDSFEAAVREVVNEHEHVQRLDFEDSLPHVPKRSSVTVAWKDQQ